MKTHFLYCFSSILCVLLLCSCSTLASVVSSGMRVAGTLGVVDDTIAYAVADSTETLGKAAEKFTPEQEYFIGRAVGAALLTGYRSYNAPALSLYLNRICAVVTINSSRPEIYNGYHVLVLDTDEINAFATSGGHIFITKGLLECSDSEDSLAAVIAHEVAHIQLGHSLKAIQTSRLANAFAVTSQAALTVIAETQDIPMLASVLDESVMDIVQVLVNKGYSRAQEFEADKKALSLLSLAGYEPHALIRMLELLERNQKEKTGGFIDTHPDPEKRIKNAVLALRNYPAGDNWVLRQERFNLFMGDL